MKAGWAILLIASLPAVADARAKSKGLPLYGHFAYSNLCWEKESGDAAGARLMLSRTRKGARLDYEYGNGPLLSAKIKSVHIEGDTLKAEAETGDGNLNLSAVLDSKRAELLTRFDFEKDQPPNRQVLKRVKSFKQKIRECRG